MRFLATTILQLTVLIASHGAWALWPIPRTLQTGTTLLQLSPTFDITINVNNLPQDLLNAVSRTRGFIQNDKLQRLVVGRGANDSTALSNAPKLAALTISLTNGATVRSISQEAIQPLGQRSEGYSLSVPSNGSAAVLTANSTLGLFRGLTTFEQLWYDLGGVVYTYQAPVVISNDTPAYVSTVK